MKILINNGLGNVDYTRYVVDGSLSIEDSINVPTMISFQLVAMDTSFVVPRRSAYVTIVSEVFAPNAHYGTGGGYGSGKILNTGFVTNEPERVYLGLGQHTGPTQNQVYTYNINVTSDEWLLNCKPVPYIPAFVNQTDGQILAAIASTLAPGFFDTSLVASGTLIPYFQYDPSQTWSDIAKTFGDANRYHYRVTNRQIVYQPFGDVSLGIAYDDTVMTEARISPLELKTGVLTVPPVNDCIVIGDTEPQTNVDNYFVGDGFTANFGLKHQVFDGTSNNLLSDDWTEASFTQGNWIVQDPLGVFSLADSGGNALGALNVIQKGAKGVYVPQTSATFIQAQNGLELGGGINLQHGQLTFNDTAASGGGIIGGLYGVSTFTPGTCLAGFGITGQSAVSALPVSTVIITQGNTQVVQLYVTGNLGPIQPGYVLTCAGFTNATFLNGTKQTVKTITPVYDGNGNLLYYILACQGLVVYGSPYSTTGDTGTVTAFANDVLVTASGTAGIVIQPIISGAYVGQPVVTQINHQYLLQTWVGANTKSRYIRPYTNLTRSSTYGNQDLAAQGALTFVITDVNIGDFVIEQQNPLFGLFPAAPPPVVTKFTQTNVILPPFALYCLVNAIDLNVSINFTVLSLPPQGFLTVQSLTGASGGSLPWHPNQLSQPIVYQLGFGQQNQTAQIGQSGEVNQLQFYTDDIPSVGARIRFQNWAAAQSIARVRDTASVAVEAAVSGDDGVRSAIMTNLSPTPRTSDECEAAAAAAIRDRELPQFQGSYSVESIPYRFENLFAPSVYDYPRTGEFFALRSINRAIYDPFPFIDPPHAAPLALNPGETGTFWFPTVSGAYVPTPDGLFPFCPASLPAYGCGIVYSPNSGAINRWRSRTLSGLFSGTLYFAAEDYPSALPRSVITRIVASVDVVCNGDFHYVQYSVDGGVNWIGLFGGTDFNGTLSVNLTSLGANYDFSKVQFRSFDNSSLFLDNQSFNVTLTNAGIWFYHSAVQPYTGSTPSNFIATTVRMQLVELKQEVLNVSVDFGPDLYLEKLLPAFLEREQNLLVPKQTSAPPNYVTIGQVLNAHLPVLDNAKIAIDSGGTPIIVNSLSGNFIQIDIGSQPVTGCEVRNVDSGWGVADQGRIGLFTTQKFTVPRTVRDQTWYLREINGAIFSRFSKSIRVVAPLIPSPPTLLQSDATKAVFDYAGDVRDIYGIELRAMPISGQLFFVLPPNPQDSIGQFSRAPIGIADGSQNNVVAVYNPPSNAALFPFPTQIQVGDIIYNTCQNDGSFAGVQIVSAVIPATAGTPPTYPTHATLNIGKCYFFPATQYEGAIGRFYPVSPGSASATFSGLTSLQFNTQNGIGGDPAIFPMQVDVLDAAGHLKGRSIIWNGATQHYDMSVSGSLFFPTPGHHTIQIYHDDGMIFGIQGATRVSGLLDDILGHTQTILAGYPILGANNHASPNHVWNDTFIVNIPASGDYPFEIDYSQWKDNQTLVVLIDGFTVTPTPGNIGTGGAPPTPWEYGWYDYGEPTPDLIGTVNLGVSNQVGTTNLFVRGSFAFVASGAISNNYGGVCTINTQTPHGFVKGDIIIIGCAWQSWPGTLPTPPQTGAIFCGVQTVSNVLSATGFQFVISRLTDSTQVQGTWEQGIAASGVSAQHIQGVCAKYPTPQNLVLSSGILLQRAVFAPSDLTIDLTDPNIATTLEVLQALSPFGRVGGLNAYFFNLTWDYSLPTAIPSFSIPSISNIVIDNVTQQLAWNLDAGIPSGYRVQVTDSSTGVTVNRYTIDHPHNKQLLLQTQMSAVDFQRDTLITITPFDGLGDGIGTTVFHPGTGADAQAIAGTLALYAVETNGSFVSPLSQSGTQIYVAPFSILFTDETVGYPLAQLLSVPATGPAIYQGWFVYVDDLYRIGGLNSVSFGVTNNPADLVVLGRYYIGRITLDVNNNYFTEIGGSLPGTPSLPVTASGTFFVGPTSGSSPALPTFRVVTTSDFGQMFVAASGTVFAGPITGSPALATFRHLVASDLPAGTTISASGGISGLIGAAGITVMDAAITGSKGFIEVPYGGIITGWTLFADISGNAQFDVKKCTYTGFPTDVSIVASSPPKLASQQKNTDSILSGWTTTINKGDVLEFVLQSSTTVTKLWLQLQISRS